MRCPICPTYMIVKRIYDVLMHVCEGCGHAEPVKKELVEA